jgi:hypothetical protein
VQAIVMVRDDFWLAVSRFMRELEVRLIEGQNSSLVDLFDHDHARKVLAAFGRAFGKLPENSNEMSKENKEFLKHAVTGLAQEGKVISVRLALFAEMMKGKPWTPAALKAVGGTQSVGVTFLEGLKWTPFARPKNCFRELPFCYLVTMAVIALSPLRLWTRTTDVTHQHEHSPVYGTPAIGADDPCCSPQSTLSNPTPTQTPSHIVSGTNPRTSHFATVAPQRCCRGSDPHHPCSPGHPPIPDDLSTPLP